MHSKNVILRVIVFSSLFLLIYLILDYLNIGYAIGLNVERINSSLLSIIVNACLAITLYIVTFEFVDKRNASKQRNKELVANCVLVDIYKQCKNNMDIMEDPSLYQKVTRFVKSNEFIEKDNKYRVFENIPFENEAFLLGFFEDGTLSVGEYKSYIANKNNYRQFMTISLIFPDLPDKVNAARNIADEGLELAIRRLEEQNV